MSTAVRRNDDENRYEIFVDDELAGFTDAQPHGDLVRFPHTQVDSRFQGRGLATQLIQGALDDVRARGLRVHATCPFVVDFLAEHPDYQDLEAG